MTAQLYPLARTPQPFQPPDSNGSATHYAAITDACAVLDYLLHAALIHREDWAKLPAEARAELQALQEKRHLLPKLVDAKLLTKYQADRIAEGSTHGLVIGSYRVLQRLGAGGMGFVYLAEHMHLRRLVAIKVMPMSMADDGDEVALARFYNEIRTVAQLQHPNIVWAIDTGALRGGTHEASTLYYHVMEYVPGKDLEELVRCEGPLKTGRACDIIYQVASALAEADKHHLVHRDIKPSNVLVTPEGQAKLLDFGVARSLLQRQTQPGVLLGTIDYIAPEQVQDASAVDIRADIYSLGGTLFWCLTGSVPFVSDSPLIVRMLARMNQQAPSARALRSDIPVELDEVITRMMAVKPEDRITSPTAVMRALMPFLRGESGSSHYLPTRVQLEPTGGSHADAKSTGAAQRVLIVDDEDPIRSLSKRILEAQGITCSEAVDGQAAMEAMRTNPADVVLLDVDMPRMTGLEVLQKLRAEPPSPNVKIIMWSGRNSTDELSTLMLAGADDFIAKPFSIQQLTARVKVALRLKAAQDRSDCLTQRLFVLNQQLEQNLQARDCDLIHARNALVLAMAELVSYRGAETPTHLQRMQGYARVLAEAAASLPSLAGKIDDAFITMLEGTTPLHDIGMIGLPEHIVLKPGKLAADEHILMQSHTTIGADILQKVARKHSFAAAFLQMAIDIVRHHHERWDGGGYPDRLTGNDIPLAARIVAFADVYDALRSRRPHKPALSHFSAVQLMTAASPGQFDPLLLQAFQHAHERFDRVYREQPN